jgi:hypothetical protein
MKHNKETKYILSKFTKKLFLKKDKYAVFNNLVLEPVLMDKKELNDLAILKINKFNPQELNK